jgi:hypothetical protein
LSLHVHYHSIITRALTDSRWSRHRKRIRSDCRRTVYGSLGVVYWTRVPPDDCDRFYLAQTYCERFHRGCRPSAIRSSAV